MKQQTLASVLALSLMVGPVSEIFAADGVIKLGVSASTSGSFASVGESAKNAVELAKQQVEATGGLKIGGKSYLIEAIYADNSSNRSAATTRTRSTPPIMPR